MMSRSRLPWLCARAWSRLSNEASSPALDWTAARSIAIDSTSQGSSKSATAAWTKLGLGFAAAFAGATTVLADSQVVNVAGVNITTHGNVTLSAPGAVVTSVNGVAVAPPAASTNVVSSSAAAPKTQSVNVEGVTIAVSGDATIKHQVIFVLGGPGSGKGTQCAMLVEDFDMAHFSAGDLLRDHVKSGTAEGNMVADMIKNGQIVPAEVTIGLLEKAMASSGKLKVLIDGFPRNYDNRETFERVVGYDCDLVLYFDCPESVLEERLLKRGESSGRTDDNLESIKKRFKVFIDQSMPVIKHYKDLGKVMHINTNRPIEQIYAEVKASIEAL